MYQSPGNDKLRVLIAQVVALVATGEVITESKEQADNVRELYHDIFDNRAGGSLLTADYGDGSYNVMCDVEAIPDWFKLWPAKWQAERIIGRADKLLRAGILTI